MADFIKREDVLTKIDDFVKLNAARGFPMGIFDIEMMRVNIAKIPAADVAPVVHGRWVDKWRCSACGEISYEEAKSDETDPNCYYVLSDYCPNCGAKMDEEVKK